MQKPGIGAIPMRLAELGTHPARLMTSAAVFDTSVHLRQDIAPAVGRDLGAVPDNTLAVTLEWMFAGLAPMNRESLSWLDAPVNVTLHGPAGGSWVVSPNGDGKVAVTSGPGVAAASNVEGRSHDFPVWATKRASWRDMEVSVSGNLDHAGRFLDSVRII